MTGLGGVAISFAVIVDCHTHVWESVEQLGRGAGLWDGRGPSQDPPKAGMKEHLAAAEPVDKTFVLALRSHYLGVEISNDFVSKYVRQHAHRLVGFASVDPARIGEALAELRRARDQLGMQGVTVWPAGQGFHPVCTSAMRLYEEAYRLKLPVLFRTDTRASAGSKMEYARPLLVDEAAREFPGLRVVVSQLGYPWTEETMVLLAKHEHVYSDISGLLRDPWSAYNVLLSAYQAGVMDRLLFGSGFPYTSPATCIESLYSVNQVCHGTNLPTIPREQLRQIVERDALGLLGIESNAKPAAREPDTTVIKAED